MWAHHYSTLGENVLNWADVAGVQKCAAVGDKVGCTGAFSKLCPTANQLGQNKGSVYSTGTSTVIVKQKQHVPHLIIALIVQRSSDNQTKVTFKDDTKDLSLKAKDQIMSLRTRPRTNITAASE